MRRHPSARAFVVICAWPKSPQKPRGSSGTGAVPDPEGSGHLWLPRVPARRRTAPSPRGPAPRPARPFRGLRQVGAGPRRELPGNARPAMRGPAALPPLPGRLSAAAPARPGARPPRSRPIPAQGAAPAAAERGAGRRPHLRPRRGRRGAALLPAERGRGGRAQLTTCQCPRRCPRQPVVLMDQRPQRAGIPSAGSRSPGRSPFLKGALRSSLRAGSFRWQNPDSLHKKITLPGALKHFFITVTPQAKQEATSRGGGEGEAEGKKNPEGFFFFH